MALLSPVGISKTAFHGVEKTTVQYLELDPCSEIQYFLATCCWVLNMGSGKAGAPKQIVMAGITMPRIFHCGKSPATTSWTF